MPFDPALPAPNSPLQSQVIRDQLQVLFVLINNVATVSAAQVDGALALRLRRLRRMRIGFLFDLSGRRLTPLVRQACLMS
jgi:hypothetical protein